MRVQRRVLGRRRSSTSKRIVTAGASGSGGFTFACQWSASITLWPRTAGIAEAITSGLVSSSNTRSRGAANLRCPSTTVTAGAS